MTQLRFILTVLVTAMIMGIPASATAFPDGLPTQEQTDLISTDPANSSHQAGWADLTGGTSNRPYISSLTVINGGTSTPVITGGSTTPPSVPAGFVTAVITPYNLCTVSQTPAPGVCYATPNRIGVTVAYNAGASNGWNFGAPSVATSPTIGPNTVIDMTIALNTLGANLRWTHVTGNMLYWHTSNLGTPSATVRIKFKPVITPYVATFPEGNGCTATPIFSCSIAQSDGDGLSASLVLSLDDTLDASLTGAAFATQSTIFGYMQPAGTASAPRLDMQISSSHLNSLGSLNEGTMQAFIPDAALLNYYGLLPGTARSVFAATRSGSSGSTGTVTFADWNAATDGSDGLFVEVPGITFSTPTYKFARTLAATSVTAARAGAATRFTATVNSCPTRAKCKIWVYDLGSVTSPKYVAKSTVVSSRTPLTARHVDLTVPTTKLKRSHRYLLVVKSRTGKVLVSRGGITP